MGAAFFAASLAAQFNGNVQGTVSDPSSAVIPNANVTLHNTQTNVDVSAHTDGAGLYRFTGVVPGPYQVIVTAPGFQQTAVRFTLQTQETQGVNVTLQVTSGTTKVTVNEQAPGINPDETRLVTTISGNQLMQLPLVNRSTLSILQLAPGAVEVSFDPGNNSNTPIGQATPQLVANGRPSTSNSYRLDGIPITSSENIGDLNLVPNPDMLRETALQTSTFTSEVGHTSSIVTDFTSKSGSNEFHGDIDGTYTSRYFQQHIWNSGASTPFTRKWLMGSLGGPIIKNKTFFFGSAETQFAQNGGSGIDTYESDQFATWAEGALPNSGFVNHIAKYRPTRDQFIQNLNYANTVYPANNTAGPACGQASSHFMPCDLPIQSQGYFTQSPILNGTQYNIRLDQYLRNGGDRIFLNYFRVDQTSDFLSTRPAFDALTPSTTNFAAANWVHTFTPTLINQAQFGWSKYYFTFGNAGVWEESPLSLIAAGGSDIPFVGYFPSTPLNPGGTTNKEHSYRFRDYLGWVKGKHSVRFGFEGTHSDYWQDQAGFYARPFNAFFSSFWNLVNDAPETYSLYTISAQTGQFQPQTYGAQVTQFGLYVQDDWKVLPNLLVSLGLRWDDYGNPYQYGDRSQPFVQVFPGAGPTGTTGQLLTTLPATSYTKYVANAFAGRQNKNFLPRLGVAWTPSKDQKTTIRGGFGLYSDPLNLGQVTLNLPTQPPNRLTLNLNANTPGLPSPVPLPYGSSPTYPYNYNYPQISIGGYDNRGGVLSTAGTLIPAGLGGSDFNLRPQKTGIWNLGIEHELPARLVAGVTYSGSYSWDLFSSPDYNALAGDSIINNGQVLHRTGEWTSIGYLRNGLDSNYNAMIATVRQSVGKLTWQASYTWSHALEHNFYNGDTASYYYGQTGFDIRHVFSLSATYEFPSPRQAFLKSIGGGWTVGSILIAHTGAPFTVFSGTNYLADGINGTSNLPDIGPGLTQTAGFTRTDYKTGLFGTNAFANPTLGTVGSEGINSFRNPGYLGWDASVEKRTALPWIGERKSTFTIRVEALNVINRTNLLGIDATIGDPNFGKSTAAVAQPRTFQLGARFEF